MKEDEDEERGPESGCGEDCPFVKGGAEDELLPWMGRRSLVEVRVGAGELNIGEDIGIAWGELLCETIVKDGVTGLTGTVECIGEIEVEGRRPDIMLEKIVVGDDGFVEETLFREDVGFGEGCIGGGVGDGGRVGCDGRADENQEQHGNSA